MLASAAGAAATGGTGSGTEVLLVHEQSVMSSRPVAVYIAFFMLLCLMVTFARVLDGGQETRQSVDYMR